MKVQIESQPDGTFMVSSPRDLPPEAQAAPGMPPEAQAAPGMPEDSAQPFKTLQEALMAAGKLLQAPDTSTEPSPFDQGVASTLPTRPVR